MPREPPVMSAALPAREIIKPPRLETRNSKLENRNQKIETAGFSGARWLRAWLAPARGKARRLARRLSFVPNATAGRRPSASSARAGFVRFDEREGAARR